MTYTSPHTTPPVPPPIRPNGRPGVSLIINAGPFASGADSKLGFLMHIGTSWAFRLWVPFQAGAGPSFMVYLSCSDGKQMVLPGGNSRLYPLPCSLHPLLLLHPLLSLPCSTPFYPSPYLCLLHPHRSLCTVMTRRAASSRCWGAVPQDGHGLCDGLSKEQTIPSLPLCRAYRVCGQYGRGGLRIFEPGLRQLHRLHQQGGNQVPREHP